ncbi:MAG: hypothetical protein LJE70_08775 [Chromatiaceae bacterium]|jgi:hypothetical protein|nr:hypothetical protein [Chromatiaceae bacterium]
MKTDHEDHRVATSSNRSASGFWLNGTLDSYEVEEIDAHDLAKLLPQLAISIDGQGAADALTGTST